MTTFTERWRSGEHVGDARPTQIVEIRTGRFVRGYTPSALAGGPVDADIYGETRELPWTANWQPRTAWRELPNVASVELDHDFSNNGIIVATIGLENVVFTEKTGPFGDVYHLIERGYLAPWRGSVSGRLRRAVAPANEWRDLLVTKAQIRVWQGYGDILRPTFTGLIDDCDLTSTPDRITIVARDFGQILTDQHIFGWNASPQLIEPFIFKAQGAKSGSGKGVGGAADASSSQLRHPPRFVLDANDESEWRSADHATPDNTEWVEIRLPRGRYESFAIHNAYPSMEMFVGVYARANGRSDFCQIDGQPVVDGWIFPSELPAGVRDRAGTIAGEDWPYLRRWASVSDKGHTNDLGVTLDLGDDSVLRVGFRNLRRVTAGVHRAGVVRLAAIQREAAKAGSVGAYTDQKHVEVGDAAEIVKVVLRWAGFKEWVIEPLGTSLTNSSVAFNRSNSLMDIVKKLEEATGHVFFMGEPSTEDWSIGVPHFVSNASIKDLPSLTEIRDTDLLTGVQAKVTDEPLDTVIRVRGKASDKYGDVLEGDRGRLVMARYDPPWKRSGRTAGLLKHLTHTEPRIRHTHECLVMAQLIALQQALVASAAEVEIPGNPDFGLNGQVALVDTGTGLNTRLYIARRHSTFTTGQRASWKTSLGGALIDTEDVQGVITDLRATLRAAGTDPDNIELGDLFTTGVAA